MGILLPFSQVLIWGTTFISTKVLLRTFEPVEILFIRFMIGYFAPLVCLPAQVKDQP